jgi:hypothetical protein
VFDGDADVGEVSDEVVGDGHRIHPFVNVQNLLVSVTDAADNKA